MKFIKSKTNFFLVFFTSLIVLNLILYYGYYLTQDRIEWHSFNQENRFRLNQIIFDKIK
jgi:hypothetical protein